MMIVIGFALYVFSTVFGPFLAETWLYRDRNENDPVYMHVLRMVGTILIAVGLILIGSRLVKALYAVYTKLHDKKKNY